MVFCVSPTFLVIFLFEHALNGAENFLRSYLRFNSGKLIYWNSLFTRLQVKAIKIRLRLRLRHNEGFQTFGAGSKVISWKIREPVIVGENCHLEHAYIGPYTSISDRVTIIDTDIEHSVILNDTKITGIHKRIVDSVIGQRVSMKVSPKRPQALRFLVGDDSQLEIMWIKTLLISVFTINSYPFYGCVGITEQVGYQLAWWSDRGIEFNGCESGCGNGDEVE